MKLKITLLWVALMCLTHFSFSQMITKSIKEFGAKGDGKTNDHDAFEKASKFINDRGGNVKLVIPFGTYIVGKQMKKDGKFLSNVDAISLENCSNVQVIAQKGCKIKYANGLKFGSFNPKDGTVYNPKMPFYDKSYIAHIGCFVYTNSCNNIKIIGLEVNGNIENIELGGTWGDTGRQLWHYGLHINNTKNIIIKNCNLHHFACDGMSLSNPTSNENNNVTIMDSRFEYNARQGLSWIGGNGLQVMNCKFNHTGKARFKSIPSAGVDIEAEGGQEIENGVFTNCEFVNNAGAGLTANSGPSKNITFNNCLFWGVTNWSAWVEKPAYTFNSCNFYGSFVKGFITTNFIEATKFYKCNFEDKKYNGKLPYGNWLLECDSRKKMIFENCIFTTNTKLLMWLNNGSINDETQRALFKNCTFNIKNNSIANNGNLGAMGSMNIEDCTFNYYITKGKKYRINEAAIKKINVKENYISR